MIPPDIAKTMREALEVRFNELDDIIRHGVYAEPVGIQETLVAIDAALAYIDTLPAAPAPDLREALAEYAHDAWSGWMKYLSSRTMHESITGGEIIPAWAVERWQRQVNTPYADLPEEEKESDRAEADKILAIMGRTALHARPTE